MNASHHPALRRRIESARRRLRLRAAGQWAAAALWAVAGLAAGLAMLAALDLRLAALATAATVLLPVPLAALAGFLWRRPADAAAARAIDHAEDLPGLYDAALHALRTGLASGAATVALNRAEAHARDAGPVRLAAGARHPARLLPAAGIACAGLFTLALPGGEPPQSAAGRDRQAVTDAAQHPTTEGWNLGAALAPNRPTPPAAGAASRPAHDADAAPGRGAADRGDGIGTAPGPTARPGPDGPAGRTAGTGNADPRARPDSTMAAGSPAAALTIERRAGRFGGDGEALGPSDGATAVPAAAATVALPAPAATAYAASPAARRLARDYFARLEAGR